MLARILIPLSSRLNSTLKAYWVTMAVRVELHDDCTLTLLATVDCEDNLLDRLGVINRN